MSNPESIGNSSDIYDAKNKCPLSQASYSGPSVCNVIDYSYPFGPACQTCKFNLSIKFGEVDHDQHGEHLECWIEEVNLRTEFADVKGSIFQGGADEKDQIAAEREARSSSPNVVIEESKVSNPSSARFPAFPQSGSDPYKTKPAYKRVPPLLSPWVDVIFDNTLEGHKVDKVFVGGATETKAVQNPCPYCNQPQGDPSLQHLVKCKFAHEEQEREERMMGYY